MNENESPLTVAEQIEVLEAAKEKLVALSNGDDSVGLCHTIESIIYDKYSHLRELAYIDSASEAIPSFTFANAVLHGMVDKHARPLWFWWSTEVSKGGITNRLNFLDYLIYKLKNEDHE